MYAGAGLCARKQEWEGGNHSSIPPRGGPPAGPPGEGVVRGLHTLREGPAPHHTASHQDPSAPPLSIIKLKMALQRGSLRVKGWALELAGPRFRGQFYLHKNLLQPFKS